MPAPLIDTHAHLDRFHRRGTLPEVLARARDAGVVKIVTIGTEPEDWALYRSLVPELGGSVACTAGLHPCSVEAGWEAAVEKLPAFFTGPNAAVGLGECGLDRFHLPKDPAEAGRIFALQLGAFRAQLALARTLAVPLVVHSRGAFADCVAEIDAAGVDWSRVVFHCFSEGPAEIAMLNGRGGRGSFTGVVTYKSAASVREAVARQGVGRLMVETDCPYLAPVPHRGKDNEPAWVRLVSDACAATLGITPGEAAEASTANARAFFNL